ncbi:MAG: hypothetical protein WBB28_01610 [Crinalium sp.]
MSQVKRFGPPAGAAGVVVYERVKETSVIETNYGTVYMQGVLPRGPMGVIVPIDLGRRQYDEIYNDPNERRWHLYSDSASLMPDAIDGFYSTGRGAGTLLVNRMDLGGNARKASKIFLGRDGLPALKISAANEGRWGGKTRSLKNGRDKDWTMVLAVTQQTFTSKIADVEPNEFIGAEINFVQGTAAKPHTVISNTGTDPDTGMVVFTVGSQSDLLAQGVSSGTANFTGTVSYNPIVPLTGTLEAVPILELAGSVAINEKNITGLGTAFTADLVPGDIIFIGGQQRIVRAITSDTSLSVTKAFIAINSSTPNASISKKNFTVTGTGTQFTTELIPERVIHLMVNGTKKPFVVESIVSDTQLILESLPTAGILSGTSAERDNYTITGVGTQFLSESVEVGSPLLFYGTYEWAKVVSVDSNVAITIAAPLKTALVNSELSVQGSWVSINHVVKKNEGLEIRLEQGQAKPATHFNIEVFFNGSRVLQVQDCSLDPNNSDFVDAKVARQNHAFSDGLNDYAKWITAESLIGDDYSTAPTRDTRPCNGAGTVAATTSNTIYTVADLDYKKMVGGTLFPDPYNSPRTRFTIQKTSAPVRLNGSVSSLGTLVTGLNTNFLTSVKVGDYLYDLNTKVARKVQTIVSQNSLTVSVPFPKDIPIRTPVKIAGSISIASRYNIAEGVTSGDPFLVSFNDVLENGYDGDLSSLSPYDYTKYADGNYNQIGKICADKNYGLVRMALPGVYDAPIQRVYIDYAANNGFEFRAEIPPYITEISQVESFINNELGRSDFYTTQFPSYAAISSPIATGDRLIPISGDLMGGESRYAVDNRSYHVMFAGSKATMPRFTKLPIQLDELDEAALNAIGVQPIKVVDGNVVPWGVRAPYVTREFRYIHVRRMQSHYIRTLLNVRNFLSLIFEPNQAELLGQARLILEGFAATEYSKGCFTNYLPSNEAVKVTAEFNASGVGDIGSTESLDGLNNLASILNGSLSLAMEFYASGILEVVAISVGPNSSVQQYGDISNSAN